ncbi:MAG: queuosine precursor transporter [Thermomicrobiales bacterium]
MLQQSMSRPTLAGNADGRVYKYFDLIMAAFVAVLLISNVTVVKVMRLGPFHLGPITLGPWATDGATLFFPLSYIFGDVLTEVYGYARSRRVIWAGFAAIAIAAVIYTIVGELPPAADWPNQGAYTDILGQVPRFTVAGLFAFWAGEFCNSFALARLKILTGGRQLWMRTIGSTIVGEAVDTGLFVFLGFVGTIPASLMWDIFVFGFLFKVCYETLATPLTYLVVNFLKRAEHEDYYDIGTNFNPFHLSVPQARTQRGGDPPRNDAA